jgi:prepilin-type N-terminal cleavage/methylation domain-containing protein
MKSLSKKSQRGYSLIELSIALAIVGVVIAGSIVGVQAILQSNNVNKTIRQTNTAVNKVIAKLVRDRNYENATTENLSAKGQEVWDPTDITSGGTSSVEVTHPLASFVFVGPLSVSGAGATFQNISDKQGFIYTLTGVPTSACTDLAVGLEGLATAMSIQNKSAIAAQGTAPKTLIEANFVKTTSSSFDSKKANQFCSGTSGASGTVQDVAEISFLVPRR